MTEPGAPKRITCFVDFTCPFSYVTEAALWNLATRHALELVPRAFELFPRPDPLPDPLQDGIALAAARELAVAAGVTIGDPRLRPRTRKAHEAAAHARRNGGEHALRAAIYRAYWEEGADIGRIDVLTGLAGEEGADPTAMKIALDIDQESPSVTADQALAHRLGVTGTPVLFIGAGADAIVLEGAHGLAALDEAIRRG